MCTHTHTLFLGSTVDCLQVVSSLNMETLLLVNGSALLRVMADPSNQRITISSLFSIEPNMDEYKDQLLPEYVGNVCAMHCQWPLLFSLTEDGIVCILSPFFLFSMLIFFFSYLVHFLLICSLLFFCLFHSSVFSFSLLWILIFLFHLFLLSFLPFPFTFFTSILTVIISLMCTVFLTILLFSDLSCDINSVCWRS